VSPEVEKAWRTLGGGDCNIQLPEEKQTKKHQKATYSFPVVGDLGRFMDHVPIRLCFGRRHHLSVIEVQENTRRQKHHWQGRGLGMVNDGGPRREAVGRDTETGRTGYPPRPVAGACGGPLTSREGSCLKIKKPVWGPIRPVKACEDEVGLINSEIYHPRL